MQPSGMLSDRQLLAFVGLAECTLWPGNRDEVDWPSKLFEYLSGFAAIERFAFNLREQPCNDMSI